MAEHPTIPMATTATIRVVDGAVVVDSNEGGNHVRVASGGTILWSSPDGAWAIVMKADRTPFANGAQSASGWPGGPLVSTPVRRDAHSGEKGETRFPYAVMCASGDAAYFLDPDIVVGPPDDDGTR